MTFDLLLINSSRYLVFGVYFLPAKLYPSSPTTSQNISTNTHPPPTKIYPPPSITTHQQPKYIYHLPKYIYPSKKVFYKKNIKIFYSEVND